MTIVFLDKQRVQFYQSRDRSLATLDVPETVMRDMEIADIHGLGELTRTFMSAHRITASPTIIILSDTVTISEELSGTKEQKDRAFQAFLSAIPLEQIQSRRYIIDGREIAIAVGKSGYEPLVSILVSEHFSVTAIVPLVALGPMKDKRWLDAEMGEYVVKEQAILAESIVPIAKPTFTETGPITLPKVNRLWVGIGVFVILLIVLVLLLFGRV